MTTTPDGALTDDGGNILIPLDDVVRQNTETHGMSWNDESISAVE